MSQLSDCEKKIFEPRFPSDYVHLLMCDNLYHVNEHNENSKEFEFNKTNAVEVLSYLKLIKLKRMKERF